MGICDLYYNTIDCPYCSETPCDSPFWRSSSGTIDFLGRYTSPGNLPDVNEVDPSATNGMAPDRLTHLAIFLRELSSTS